MVPRIVPVAERNYEVFCYGDADVVRRTGGEKGAAHRLIADIDRGRAKAVLEDLLNRCPRHGGSLYLYRYNPAELDDDDTTWGQ